MAKAGGLSISEMKRRNEEVTRTPAEVRSGTARIWQAMAGSIDRGLATEGTLPGGLKSNGAPRECSSRCARQTSNRRQPHAATDWLYLYAMAVNEENAAGGRIVGAHQWRGGVVPAVVRYYLDHCIGSEPDKVEDFLLTSAAIGGLIKHNASISGAEADAREKSDPRQPWLRPGSARFLGTRLRSRMPRRSRWSIISA